MNPIEWIVFKMEERKVEKIMGNLMDKLSGYKTYITGILGMLLLIAGHFWGPLHLGPVDIPLVDSKTMMEGLWGGAMALFIRHGVSTARGPTTVNIQTSQTSNPVSPTVEIKP